MREEQVKERDEAVAAGAMEVMDDEDLPLPKIPYVSNAAINDVLLRKGLIVVVVDLVEVS